MESTALYTNGTNGDNDHLHMNPITELLFSHLTHLFSHLYRGTVNQSTKTNKKMFPLHARLINSDFVQSSVSVRYEQLTGVQECPTTEVLVVVEWMGLQEGISSSKCVSNLAP